MTKLRIDRQRLLHRLESLGGIGALEGGGVCRLALTDEDRAGRDQLVAWMEELGLTVSIDPIGNIIGLRPGREDGPPVMTGSHIDTVRTGGLYDGNLGVLAGLEVVEVLNRAGLTTRRPLAVAAFTNEEGARFQPDMLGSLVYAGGLDLDTALKRQAIDGPTLGEELARIGYAGTAPLGGKPRAFVELHIEQGPVLERDGVTIGVVESVQGISWSEYTITGTSNHAGTTPMELRHDAGFVAGAAVQYARLLANKLGGHQVATVGRVKLYPDLINVIPNKAVFTVDLRNTDEQQLQRAEAMTDNFVNTMANQEGCRVASRRLARFAPVTFDPHLVDRVEAAARRLDLSTRRLPSGAGHDAQMMARLCPTAMIFTPSRGGISHNIHEYTEPEQLEAGANVLLAVLLELAGEGNQ